MLNIISVVSPMNSKVYCTSGALDTALFYEVLENIRIIDIMTNPEFTDKIFHILNLSMADPKTKAKGMTKMLLSIKIKLIASSAVFY